MRRYRERLKNDPVELHRQKAREKFTNSSLYYKRPDICSVCGINPNKIDKTGTNRIHGHHPDYSQPLTVIWVCAKCHKAIHNKNKENEVNNALAEYGVNCEDGC